MGLLKKLKSLIHPQPAALPMHPENILIITSDARTLYEVTQVLYHNNYKDNSPSIRLDNGDFAQVVKKG